MNTTPAERSQDQRIPGIGFQVYCVLCANMKKDTIAVAKTSDS